MTTSSTTTGSTTTGSLRVPGARLHYEVRGTGPLVALVGAPMGAAAFEPLAGLLAADYTVLTTDPRGIGRSPVDDPEQDSTPPLRADDLSRLVTEVDAGPAMVLGSSGGACTALAFAQAHPDQARRVIAHEPPLDELLPDRDELFKRTDEMIATYLAGDVMGAWRAFMALSSIDLPDAALEQMFGGERDPQDAADERRWFAHELRETVRWKPDLVALRVVRSRLVIGIGEDSAGELCDRASRALGEAVDVSPTLFPGGHTGFADDPEPFAARLREVLAA
ncbi:alpha/beta fold hydrolase [Actinomadura welshii]